MHYAELGLYFSLYVHHSLYAVRLVYILDHAHLSCVNDQKYQLLTTPIFPQNSDKT